MYLQLENFGLLGQSVDLHVESESKQENEQ